MATTEARDWSVVDSWLASQFPGRQPPPFERNADTLKALLALIAFNEAASEDDRLLARIDGEVLGGVRNTLNSEEQPDAPNLAAMRDSLLDIVEQELPKEGKLALGSLTAMSLSANIALPEPQQLGAAIINMQVAAFEVEQMAARSQALDRQICSEITHAREALAMIESENYSVPDGLGKRNMELQRAVKAMAAQAPEFEKRIAALKGASASSEYTVHDILQEEQDYLTLVESRKELEKRTSAFRGLPSDPDLARSELRAYRQELQGITSKRDAAFQGLVERETPVKRR